MPALLHAPTLKQTCSTGERTAMSPEHEKYLEMDERLASEIAHLTLELEDEERKRRRALSNQGTGYTWGEFIAILVVATLLLNSLLVHMGHQLGWWDTNALVSAADQRLSELNAYESENVALLYGAHALGWLGGTLSFIFFALPYQVLALATELLSMVLPVAVPFVAYVEGVILGIAALIVLKACPLVQGIRTGLTGIGNAEVSSSKRRTRAIKRELAAKEAERRRLPTEKVMAARQAEMEERHQREAEEGRLREEAERAERQREAEQRRREEEAELQREEEARRIREEEAREQFEIEALRQRVHDLYWDDSLVPSSTGSDILILSGDTERAKKLAESLRRFRPDNREVFEISQVEQAAERLRSGKGLAVYLLVSEALSEEQLYRFYMTDIGMRGVLVLRVEDDAWANEEGACSEPENFFDRVRHSNNYRLTVKRLDARSLEMMYLVPGFVSNAWEEGDFPLRKELGRRFARYLAVAKRNRESWHLEGRTLVIDGRVQSFDGRAPWADARNSFTRVVLRDATALAAYDEEHRSLCHDWRLEGLFEGCANLDSVDLSQMNPRFNYCDELANSFLDCPRLREVRVPDCWPLINGLLTQGFYSDGDGVWRRLVPVEVSGSEVRAPRGKHARRSQD